MPLINVMLGDGRVSKFSLFEYARKASEIEQKIIDLLDRSFSDDLAENHSDMDLQESAHQRQGQKPSG